MNEDIHGLKKHLIDPFGEVEDRLSFNPQYPFCLLKHRSHPSPRSIILSMRLLVNPAPTVLSQTHRLGSHLGLFRLSAFLLTPLFCFFDFFSFDFKPAPYLREALMNSLKRGWGSIGLDLNSGWNWHPRNQGWSFNSTISTSPLSGDVPLIPQPRLFQLFRVDIIKLIAVPVPLVRSISYCKRQRPGFPLQCDRDRSPASSSRP